MNVADVLSYPVKIFLLEVLNGVLDFGVLLPAMKTNMQEANYVGFSSPIAICSLIFFIILIAPIIGYLKAR
ncbi:hypothetical protein [Ferroplasma sp.]|uniref:hypothetical protein n=1 Tax=Ferroplasma sp. TaxID=2591003 RepID=UPI002602DCAA|nr:hypothetical protein [Ferroplasma sp.]